MATEAPPTLFLPRITVEAAKFLCGGFGTGAGWEQGPHRGPVRPGNYASAIDTTTRSPLQPMFFRKKTVLLFAKADLKHRRWNRN